jgi:hypothetical protein
VTVTSNKNKGVDVWGSRLPVAPFLSVLPVSPPGHPMRTFARLIQIQHSQKQKVM